MQEYTPGGNLFCRPSRHFVPSVDTTSTITTGSVLKNNFFSHIYNVYVCVIANTKLLKKLIYKIV